MQAVVVIPALSVLRNYPDAENVLTREIAGVPLLIRVIATARRAGVDSLLVIWPPDVDPSIWNRCAASPLLQGLRVRRLVQPFDPREPVSWSAIAAALEDQFLWLPWNWVTHQRYLTGLSSLAIRPVAWDAPVLLEKRAAIDCTPIPRAADVRRCEKLARQAKPPVPPSSQTLALQARWDRRFRLSGCTKTNSSHLLPEGVSITPRENTAEAEKFLVAHSGKLTDGIHSNFNRWLCRPAVRLLTHTRVTPNWVTIGGLIVGILAALLYAQGFYAAYVAGALLFFLSGLIDEMDGMLARIKFRESVFGTWFEGLVDEATYLFVFSGITAGLYRQRGPGELIYGYLLIIGCALSVLVTRLQRRLATAPDRPQEYAGRLNRLLESDSSNLISRIARHIQMFIKKGVVIHYLLIFTVLGGLPLLLRLAAFGANLTWILTLYFSRRFFRRGKTRAGIREAQPVLGRQ